MGIVSGLVGIGLILLGSISGPFKTPESAQCYNGKIYISNIGNLPPDRKDGDGYISLALPNGKVVKARFALGLNAPKGIAFAKGKMFVADIDKVVVINPNTGKVLISIPIPGSRFLNDTAYNGKKVYVSDTLTNSIYEIDPDTYEVKLFLKNDILQGPNGIAFKKNGDMIVVSYGSGKVFDIDKNKSIKTIGRVNGFLDGVVVLDDGTILFSDFAGGRIFALKNGKLEVVKMGLVTPADIGYCKGVLLVPEFSANTVKMFKVKR